MISIFHALQRELLEVNEHVGCFFSSSHNKPVSEQKKVSEAGVY